LIFLSDVLGLSLLVDSIDHPKPPASTDGTVLGPFLANVNETVASGTAISHDPNDTPLLFSCTVIDYQGRPVVGVDIDVWEMDSMGFYDVQYAEREAFDGQAVICSDEHEAFHFGTIVPVPYPIFDNGPVGKLLK
jgi:protocatechuate 3,4-dioxygenase beta subunit